MIFLSQKFKSQISVKINITLTNFENKVQKYFYKL